MKIIFPLIVLFVGICDFSLADCRSDFAAVAANQIPPLRKPSSLPIARNNVEVEEPESGTSQK